MQYDKITLAPELDYYLTNKDPEKTQAFLDGLRKAGEIIEALGVDEFMRVAQKHTAMQAEDFLPLFVNAAEARQIRQRHDAEAKLDYCDPVNVLQFLAFLLDVPALDDRLCAVTETGELLEDDYHHPLPDKVNPGWSYHKIESYQDDTIITREAYLALDEGDQASYNYRRYFTLTKDDVPAVTISDNDRYVIGILLQEIILMADERINSRLYLACFGNEEFDSCGSLYVYRDLVLEAMKEVADSYGARRGVKTSGELLLTQIEQFMDSPDNEAQLEYACMQVGAEVLERWCDVIDACYYNNDEALADFVTDMDIINYRDKINQPFLAHAFDATNPVNWKVSFKNIFVPKTARRLAALVAYAYEEYDGDISKVPDRCLRVLGHAKDCLAECGYTVLAEEDDSADVVPKSTKRTAKSKSAPTTATTGTTGRKKSAAKGDK